MATSQSLPTSSIAPSMKPEALTDFVLFEENEPIYFDSRQFIHQSNPQFHSAPIHSDNYVTSSASRVGVVDWSAMLENPSSIDNNLHPRQQQQQQQQQQEAVSKPFYPMDLPPATSASSFDNYTAYTGYGISESFADEMPPAPGVLVHPPTFPYPSNIPQDDYRQSPFPSPVTSAGGWDGHSSVTSALSGSEAGSNSPYLNDDGLYTTQYPTGTFFTQLPVTSLEQLLTDTSATGSVDPSLISIPSPNQVNDDAPASASSHGSPDWQSAPSPASNPASPVFNKPARSGGSVGRLSPYPARERPAPYPTRRPSVSSQGSRRSHGSPIGAGNLEWFEDPSGAQSEIFAGQQLQRAASAESHRSRGARAPSSSASVPSSHSGVGSSGKDTVCPECNKSFRDLRAHQLTHQLERPVKCPIATCEYSKKGFARKYDCQRHTLTHYKGTMVCGFCPGSGSAVEKSFNRADVFKRHLMSVHNVEQTPPNGRKKIGSKQGSFAASPTEEDRFSGAYITGKCSICAVTFATAQQFYEHLDECVQLKVVQEEPAAAFNEMNLDSVKLEDMEDSSDKGKRFNKDEDEEDEEDVEEEDDPAEEGEDGADDGKDETFTPPGRKSTTGKPGRNGSKRATRGGAKKPASGNGSGGSRPR